MACVVTMHVNDATAFLYDSKEECDSYVARLRNEHEIWAIPAETAGNGKDNV